MKILSTFKLGADYTEVIIDGENIMFRDIHSGVTTTIHGLRLNKAGSIREHPDLEDDPDWQKKTIERFKEHVKKFKTGMEKLYYVRDELIKHGYQPMYFQIAGHRTKRF